MSETRPVPRSVVVQPQLEIVEGLHTGVRLDLNDGEYSVGPTPNSDIVLRDKGILARHAMLRVERGEVRVEATGGDVWVGTLKVAAGNGCRVRLPAVINLGEASLRLSRSGAEATLFGKMATAARGLSDRPMGLAGGVLLSAATIAVALQSVPQATPDGAKSQLAISGAVGRTASTEETMAAKANSAAAAASTVKQAADDLEGRLRSAGVHGVRITTENQRISATGRLTAAHSVQWAAIQRWFDEKYGSSVVLTANVALGQSGPLLRLQSVWYGERPYIIADNGSHYYEGSVLESGWIVQSISNDSLLLRKDDETFALTYR
jgi:hypothetical protein